MTPTGRALRHDPLTPDLIVRALRHHRDRPVLRISDRSMSAAEVADEISRYLQVWATWGLGPGSAAAILAANRPEVLLAMGAAIVGGVRWTPLHPLGSADDHAFALGDAAIDTLFYDPGPFGDRAAALLERVPTLKRIVPLVPGGDDEDLTTLAARFGSRTLRAAEVDLDDACNVLYTGGTTGIPKGAVGNQRNMAAMTAIQMAEWEWPNELRMLCATPLSHAAGALFLPTLLRGGTLVVLPTFDPDLLIDTIERERITATMLVPTMIYRLLESDRLDTADLSSLETLFYGASAISPNRLQEAIERLGPIFSQFYGQAECPMTITVLRRSDHIDGGADRLNSCGRPVPWVDVTLRDADDQEVQAGMPGEICVRGSLVIKEYLNQPSMTADAFRRGRLHTGDIAVADDGGFLTIVDRKKDMIVTGGFNVFPREVEDVISTHPRVAAVAVIGVPDDTWGEAVKAIVVLRPESSTGAGDLIGLVKSTKGAASAPKSVDFVDAIPLTPLGKPDKKAIRSQYWGAHDRQVN